jgi:hypothetical protein
VREGEGGAMDAAAIPSRPRGRGHGNGGSMQKGEGGAMDAATISGGRMAALDCRRGARAWNGAFHRV